MSWTHDFGVVKSAAELRKQPIRARVVEAQATGRTAEDSKADLREQGRAILEHVEAARDAAAVIIESPAFAEHPVQVFASGQANVGHEPLEEVVAPVEMELRDGEVVEVDSPLAPAALEAITVTITQVASASE